MLYDGQGNVISGGRLLPYVHILGPHWDFARDAWVPLAVYWKPTSEWKTGMLLWQHEWQPWSVPVTWWFNHPKLLKWAKRLHML